MLYPRKSDKSDPGKMPERRFGNISNKRTKTMGRIFTFLNIALILVVFFVYRHHQKLKEQERQSESQVSSQKIELAGFELQFQAIKKSDSLELNQFIQNNNAKAAAFPSNKWTLQLKSKSDSLAEKNLSKQFSGKDAALKNSETKNR